MSIHVITGGAGFVGVNLARRLLDRGETVLAVDDLSRGRRELLAPFDAMPGFAFAQADCSDAEALTAVIERHGGARHLWHLAANSDIPAGVADPRIDIERTFLTTVGALAAMKRLRIGALHFASSSAIYGDLGTLEIHEDIGPLEPISNYGAMKLASEAQIRAAVESDGFSADICRFPNVIGIPATHGVIWDFVRKLIATPERLEVLGDGTQRKAYLHVNDLVDAMLHIAALDGSWKVFNIGPTDDGITVRRIAEIVRDQVSPGAEIVFGAGARGWVGDVPTFRYSTARIARSGWSPRTGSVEAVRRAVLEIARQELGA